MSLKIIYWMVQKQYYLLLIKCRYECIIKVRYVVLLWVRTPDESVGYTGCKTFFDSLGGSLWLTSHVVTLPTPDFVESIIYFRRV